MQAEKEKIPFVIRHPSSCSYNKERLI